MFKNSPAKTLRLTFAIPVLLLLISGSGAARGQSNAKPSMRDQTRAIQRAELDRLIVGAMPAKTDSEPDRVAVLKQTRQDFKDLQELNNKMMATAWSSETLDYSFLSDMVSRIRGKATRLKANLNLPDPTVAPAAAFDHKAADPQAASDPDIRNAGEFRKALMLLDKTIMRFVTNPLFQTPNTLEVDLATTARQDIETVISLTADLKKTAARLRKSPDSH
jgi:phospholipase/lecithinase/hemolysin